MHAGLSTLVIINAATPSASFPVNSRAGDANILTTTLFQGMGCHESLKPLSSLPTGNLTKAPPTLPMPLSQLSGPRKLSGISHAFFRVNLALLPN
jgi:hypothetical protein